jgi:hypothetical protein
MAYISPNKKGDVMLDAMLSDIIWIILLAFFVKGIALGSDFSFYYMFKYGRKYLEWYKKRETFRNFIEREKAA